MFGTVQVGLVFFCVRLPSNVHVQAFRGSVEIVERKCPVETGDNITGQEESLESGASSNSLLKRIRRKYWKYFIYVTEVFLIRYVQ